MKRRAIVVGVFATVISCVWAIVGVGSRSAGQSASSGGAVAALAALAQTPAAHEVWVAVRADGVAGAGGVTDPFDASTVEKFNALFARFRKEYGENLTIHFGPGVFYGDRLIDPLSYWKFRGAGRDVTIIRTKPDVNATQTIGIRNDESTGGVSGVEVSDITFDFNTPNLRKANRVFVWFEGKTPRVYYYYVENLPAWSDKQGYQRNYENAVSHKGAEYICVTACQGKEPAQNDLWSVLRPCDPAKVPNWEKDKQYGIGDAVWLEGKGYICVAANTKSNPSADGVNWRPFRSDAPDPHIYTTAVFVNGKAPRGGQRALRCKAINGNGSWFFGRESFIFGLGGNDCAIEDCQIADFQGDYGSLMVIYGGQGSVIRNCCVRGNGGVGTLAYGGWAVHDATYEGNYCNNVSCANNIDSLTCHNVTFRGNTFMGCHGCGLLVNVGGVTGPSGDPSAYKLNVNGADIDAAWSQLDGLFIHDNLIELADDCPYGGIQTQQGGLTNVKIHNNVIRTHDGKGHGRRAIGVLGKPGMNVLITDNTCDPDMYCEIGVPATGWGNVDLQGQLIKGLEKLTRPGQ